MKKALLLLLFLVPLCIYSYPPSIDLITPKVIAKDIKVSPNENLETSHKPTHTITLEIKSGSPLQGWMLYMHLDKSVKYNLGDIDANTFPLYWRIADSSGNFERIFNTKTLIKESVPGKNETVKIELAVDTAWEIEPGDYIANLNFSLESIL